MKYNAPLHFYKVEFFVNEQNYVFYKWSTNRTRALNLARVSFEKKLNFAVGSLYCQLKDNKLLNNVTEVKYKKCEKEKGNE